MLLIILGIFVLLNGIFKLIYAIRHDMFVDNIHIKIFLYITIGIILNKYCKKSPKL